MGCRIVLISLYELDSWAIRVFQPLLEQAGHSVWAVFFKQLNANNTMDPATDSEFEALVGEVLRHEPDLIGLSLRSIHTKLATRLTRRLQRERPGTVVAWGGSHPTICPEASIAVADVICVGEGEAAVVELADAIAAGGDLTGRPNLWVRRDGQIHRNEPRRLQADLDSLPWPDFSTRGKVLIDGDHHGPPPPPESKQSYWMMTSRGCPYDCTYCCAWNFKQTYRGKGSYVRRRGVASVIEELEHARRFFPNLIFVNFFDDVFTFNEGWVREFAPRYKARVGLPFFCYCHPRATSPEVTRLLAEAGCVHMTLGIQSGSERMRREHLARRETNAEILATARMLCEAGLKYSYDLILDNPLETEADRRETLELVLALPRPNEMHTHTLTHFPRTRLTEDLLMRGLIGREDIEDVRQMSYERWTPTLDLRRDRENMFWDAIYYMANKQSVPREWVRRMSRSRLLRAAPQPLTLALRLLSPSIHTVRRGSRIDAWRARQMGRLTAALHHRRQRAGSP